MYWVYIYKLSNGAITWCSKRQETVALSTTEAEHMALSWAAREAIWLKNFGQELDVDMKQTIVIGCDNQSAIALTKSDGYRGRSRHIDIQHHHLRDKVNEKVIRIGYVNTSENVADSLTKAGPKNTFCALEMGLWCPSH